MYNNYYTLRHDCTCTCIINIYTHALYNYALQSDHSPMDVSVRDIGGLSLLSFLTSAAVEERGREHSEQ